ncbi:MAG TPA: EamA family transporter [Egibacteraceae bacterium]|nr:EamA family transporter [Egibacteraceae bacterium]
MEPQITGPGRITMTAFSATVLIGGMNFIAVKFSNVELAPLFGAGTRFAAGALVFFAIARIRGMDLPRGRALAGAAIYGMLGFGLFYALRYFALLGISAGMTSVILASLPLITLVLAVLHGQERFTMRGVAGGVLALGGIAVLSLRTLGGDLPLLPLLAAVAGAFAAAEATVLVKGFPKSDPITTNAVGMAVGSVGLLLASALFQESWALPGLARTWVALAWLVAVGSVALFALFLFVIKRWTASASAYAGTLMPVVTVGMGALLLDEPVTPEVVAGGALVILGVYVGALSGMRPTARPRVPAPSAVEDEALA